jgi:hypothetical protein
LLKTSATKNIDEKIGVTHVANKSALRLGNIDATNENKPTETIMGNVASITAVASCSIATLIMKNNSRNNANAATKYDCLIV